jgi:HEAT repeat protein
MGFEVVLGEGQCDAVLDYNLTGTSTGASYYGEKTAKTYYCYSGAHLEGRVSLSAAGQVLTQTYVSHTLPPRSLEASLFCSEEPWSFYLRGIVSNVVAYSIRDLWGPVGLALVTAQWKGTARTVLKEMGQEAVPPLVEALDGGEWQVRRAAALAIGRLSRSDRTIDLSAKLLAMLQDEREDERELAALALTEYRKSDDIKIALLAALKDESANVRALAAEGLGPYWRDTIPDLIEVLQTDEAAIVRQAAALALAETGDRRAVIPALIDALEYDEDEGVRAAALEALKSYSRSTYSLYKDDAAGWREWWEGEQ